MFNRIALKPKGKSKYFDLFNTNHIVRVEDNTKNGKSTCIIHLVTGDNVEVQEDMQDIIEQLNEEEQYQNHKLLSLQQEMEAEAF